MKNRGFTLIEVMIVVAIIAILVAIVMPAYSDYVTRAKRADGKSALLAFQLAQEKYRANNPTYAAAASLGLPANSEEAHYTINVSGAVSATTYSLIAQPNASQNDPVCETLTIDQSSNKSAVNGSVSPADAQATCWSR
jgi:type IV pilus assembly protein PilE